MNSPLAIRVSLLGALLLSPVALAKEKVIVSPGVLFSVSKRPERTALGLGAEVSAWTYPDSEGRSGGGFVQWQSMEFDHQRFCAGIQGSWEVVGMEFGATYETANADRASTLSFHAAPYLSIAVFSVALRVGIPLKRGDDSLPSHGYDVGLAFGLKYPIGLLR
ncbi:hypothetical protein [Hyalangium minutum]|uniref:Outer membrane protein beta-barrel domain-containing protein n=1 Tax=Hyalangium minutum TaxID=394096 RepID=A0A085W9F5_9BACT|nr:hypothetical protein [Hyalangium minutum]KFE64318.1 hypothetical protein DB31_2112 [Hyalangium minutum]